MRSTSVLPDLSSANSRVSDTVSTAILSGTNCRVSSMPGMGASFLIPPLTGEGRSREARSGWGHKLDEQTPTRSLRSLPSPLQGEGYFSQRRRREGVAGRDLALFQSGGEPALALRRGAMREGIRHHIAARLLLQAVVADRRRRLQRGYV